MRLHKSAVLSAPRPTTYGDRRPRGSSKVAKQHLFESGLLAALLLFGASVPAMAAETESAIARGGRLYDKWFTENKAAKPAADHPAYTVKDGKYGKDTSWRCKECHGWDYMGKDGAYAKGGHATGIKGIGGANGKDPAAIVAMLRDKHGYTTPS